jgi:hypothetical protein
MLYGVMNHTRLLDALAQQPRGALVVVSAQAGIARRISRGIAR